jgi:hypothetical protein
MTPQQAAIRQAEERVVQRCAQLLIAHPDATVRVCLSVAMWEEQVLYGNAYGPTPTGLLGCSPLRGKR